ALARSASVQVVAELRKTLRYAGAWVAPRSDRPIRPALMSRAITTTGCCLTPGAPDGGTMLRSCQVRRCRPLALALVAAAILLGAAISQFAMSPAAGTLESIHMIEGNPKNHNQVL